MFDLVDTWHKNFTHRCREFCGRTRRRRKIHF